MKLVVWFVVLLLFPGCVLSAQENEKKSFQFSAYRILVQKRQPLQFRFNAPLRECPEYFEALIQKVRSGGLIGSRKVGAFEFGLGYSARSKFNDDFFRDGDPRHRRVGRGKIGLQFRWGK